MVRPKLILICQSLGEFVASEDGTLSYNGGEAHAVDITPETFYNELKLKLAEMCNLEQDSLSIKYFLPGNRRTLITLANDRDLKRMYDFHGSSITAEIFVQGKPGFKPQGLNSRGRPSGAKAAKTVMPIAAIAAASRSMSPTSPPDNANPSRSTQATSDANANNSATIDMKATPADTVKKRRRAASQKISAKRSNVAATPDDVGKKPKATPRKRKAIATKRKAVVVVDDDDDGDDDDDDYVVGQEHDHSSGFYALGSTNDLPPEQLVALWKDGITGPEQEFKSVYEFRDALQKYAVAHRFVYRLKKNDTNRASGKCVSEGCPWRIYASWDQSTQTFKIRSMNKTHTCGGESWKTAHPAKNWVVSVIKDKLQESPHHKPKEIAKGILRDFGVELNYTQVWRGISDARAQLQGSYKEAYNQLPWLCEKLGEANPGSFIKLVINDDRRFQRLFMSFRASINGFQNGCRPIIFLESSSLKSKYHEILLTATALDGDDGLFPVAFAIVDNENDDSWRWFLEQLKSALSMSQSITFVSDREKGLKNSVLEVFENAHHGYSMYHLSENLRKNSKGPFYGDGKSSLRINLMAAAQAVRVDFFKMHAEQIKRVCSQAYDWLMQVEPEYWASSSFKGEPYNHITSDVAELYANWIAEVRETPLAHKIEVLRSKTMELIITRRTDSSEWSARLTPSKEEKLRDHRNKAHCLKVLFSSETLFEVQGDATHVVDITKQTCTCLMWKSTGMPCCHAIAVFNCTGRNMYSYCSKYFTVDTYRLAYAESINPVLESFKPSNDEETESETSSVLPPLVSRSTPQTKKKEKEEEKENEKEMEMEKEKEKEKEKENESNSEVVVKKTRIVTCARCRGTGHNKATCKADI